MLPPEVLIKIFSFLDFKTTQKTCTLVSIRLVFLKLNNFYLLIRVTFSSDFQSSDILRGPQKFDPSSTYDLTLLGNVKKE